MRIAGIDFPQEVWNALRSNRLVVFAGAGVSVSEPAGLPDFRKLAREIARGTGDCLKAGEPEDYFLGRLVDQRGTRVHARAARLLSKSGPMPTDLHQDLLRIFRKGHKVRLVTTNFDELFEQAACSENLCHSRPEVFCAPALPLGHSFSGIVHLHGKVSSPNDMVMTDADFGRAYLTEGWARRFLLNLFRQYTVLFVGYSHSETIMNYLARSLPVGREYKRFALADSKRATRAHWQRLGIDPIPYPLDESDRHRRLFVGIKGLADTARWSILDWKRAIEHIAEQPPPQEREAADIIQESLRCVAKTRFFANAASDPAWIGWLDENWHLSALFGHRELSEAHGVLSWWLSNRFARDAPDRLFLLYGKYGARLHPNLWWKIGKEISKNRTELKEDVLSRWVSVMIDSIPEDSNSHHVLASLGALCVQHGLFKSLLQIFDSMSAGRIALREGFPLEDEEKASIDLELPPTGASHALWELWRDCLKPNLEQVAEPLLRIAVRVLEERHRIFEAWQKASREWDKTSWSRSAIEPHEQDDISGSNDVFIDVARDSLEWLTQNRTEAGIRWRSRLANADAPLLRRLAIHSVAEHTGLTADEKIGWLLDVVDLNNSSVRHEVFRLTELAYCKACRKIREALIAAIREFQSGGSDQSKWTPEKLTAWHRFKWFYWLHEADSDCPLARQALNEVWQEYSDFRPREQLDLNSWISPLPEEGPTVDELLARPAAEWVGELLSSQPSKRESHDHFVRERNLVEAAKRDTEWGLALALDLAKEGKWNTDIWRALLYAWRDMCLEEADFLTISNWLGEPGLYEEHAYEVASVLLSLVQNRGKSYALNLLSKVNSIATTLWQDLDQREIDDLQDDWVHKAHDHPAGTLTEFWIHGLSVWRNSIDPMPDALNDEFRAALSMIVKDPSLPGKLGRSVLVREFAFLLAADREWAIEYLLPLFDPKKDDWELAREGLAHVKVYPAVAELLDKAFLEAVDWSSSQDEYVRGQFIQRYTLMMACFIEDPLDSWIPKLLNDGGEDIGEVFSAGLSEDYLRDMDETTQKEWWQSWLRDYWENRIEGVPYALTPKEVAKMLHWPAQLTAVFPEAVELAVKMGKTTSEHGNLLHYLDKNNLADRFPNELACFLLHLDNMDVQEYWWQAKDLFGSLLQSTISEDLKQSLREVMARQGVEE